MVPRAFESLASRRSARARILADRYPASREGLLFFAEVAELQGRLAPTVKTFAAVNGASRDVLAPLLAARPKLCALVRGVGPDPLREAARTLDRATCHQALLDCLNGRDMDSPRSFFARVLLQTALHEESRGTQETDLPHGRKTGPEQCPLCGHRPQAGSWRPQGDGRALDWTCSLCLHRWPGSRAHCPSCGRSGADVISHFGTPDFEALQVQACESCKAYVHTVDLAKDPEAIADVDELAALPLDVWAREAGYRKLRSNLIGI